MSSTNTPPKKRGWLPGLLITIATVVAMMGLVRISPLTAWLISAGGLLALLTLFYWAGKSK